MSETYELSPVQRWMWDQGIGQGAAAEVQAVFALDGAAPEAVHRALAALAGRNEILRTRFPILPGRAVPVQQVDDTPGWTAGIAQDRLVLRLPALAADRPGLVLLGAALRRELDGVPPVEAPQYPDIAGWLSDLATGEQGEAGRRFWARLAPAAAGPAVPPPGARDAMDAAQAAMPQGIDAAAAAAGVDRDTLLLGAWHLVLRRLSGAGASHVAVATDGRDQAMFAQALGPLARWLPGVFAPDLRAPLAAALPGLAVAVAERRRWQDVTPGGTAAFGFRVDAGAAANLVACDVPDPAHALRLVVAGEALRVEGLGAAPVLDGLVALLEAVVARPDAACEDLPSGAVAPRAPVAVAPRAPVAVAPRAPVSATFVATGPDDAATGDRQHVLRQKPIPLPTGRPGIPGEVSAMLEGLATAGTLAALRSGPATVVEAGATVAHPVATPLHALVLAQAARTPQAPAVVWGDRTLSYAVLVERARGVAGALQAAGVVRGDVVGLAAERCEALLPALLGIVLSGAAWCPLEPGQPSRRLEAMAQDAGLRVVVCGPGLAAPAGCRAVAIDAAAAAGPLPELGGADGAYVLFTSGSTGRPKGVAVSHAAIVNRLGWMQRAYPIGPGERVLQKTPLGFDVCVWELFWPLVVGAAVVVAPPGAHRDPEALAEQMRRHDVGVLHFVPSMLRAFLEAAGIEDRCGRPRLVFASGEALTADLVAAWRGRFAVPLHNLYGPTEAAVDVTAWTCGAAEEAGEVPIGRPVDNVVARVLDGGMRRVPVGVQGGLWLGGVQLARGYAGAPGLTAEAFRPDPFGAPGERLYRTGDVAAWRADGALVYRGRADAQVKLHGVRIETGEVEAALLAHPGVREAAVRLVEDRLVGWVAPGVPEDIEAFLAARLPAPMRPGVLVAVARMPLTASGKLDRRALVLPEADQRAGIAPRDAREAALAAIWAGVLGREAGVTDDFFRLGGDSIRGLQVVARARRAGLLLPADAVFRHPTIAEQALAAEGVPLHEPAPEDGAWFPLHAIQAEFLDRAGEEAFHEVQSLLLRPDPRPDPAQLAQALAAVQRRHGMLRARFERGQDGSWRQRVAPDAPDPVPEGHDLRADPAALEAVGAALKRSLDIAAGPVWRAALVDLPDGPALLVVAHHLVVDRVSWGPLLDDLARALAGAPLDPPPPAFAQWVAALPPRADDAPALPADLPLDDPGADPAEGAGGRLDRAVVVRPEMAGQAQVLAALARALAEWAAHDAVAVDVEHHGRDAGVSGAALDTSQIVGWFTVLATVRLPAGADAAAARAALDDALRRPGARPRAQVLANHLGTMDGGVEGLAVLHHPTGPDRSPLRPRSHPIELVTALAGGRLHCTWRHGAQLRSATLARLAALFERHLVEAGAPPVLLRRRLPPGALAAIEAQHGPVEAVLPTTPAQQGMLYHSALDPEGGAYVEQSVLRFAGALDAEGLRAGWTALVQRHAALRTLFVPDAEGMPAQVVLRRAAPAWRFEDWRGRAGVEAALAEVMAQDRRAGFDAAAAPPLRFRLLRLDDGDWWFLWTRHHALLDGWSHTPLLGELMAQADGRALPSPPDAVAIADHLTARDAAADREFWRGRLAGAQPTPLGGRAAAGPARATARCDRRVPAGPLLAFARRAGVTPASMVAAAWGIVLAEGAGQREALFGMTSSGRSALLPGAETAVGMFLAVLPVRLVIDRAATPEAFLRRLQAELAALRAHERCPPAEMLAAAGLPPGTNLATSLLTFENYPTDPSLAAPRAQGPRITAVETVEQSSFALSLLAGLEGEDMLLSLRHDPARVPSEAAARRLDRVAAVLEGLATAATLAAVLPAPATAVEGGATVAYPVATPLHALVLAQAARTPQAPAVVWGDRTLSYAVLVERARGVAGALQAAGVVRGDVVGLAAERCEALLPALLGIVLSGAAWCPLEPGQPSRRLEAMAQDAGLRVVVCGPGLAAPAGCRAVAIDAAAAAGPLPELGGADGAYVLFTSGSTGRPKGVAVSHAAIVNRLGWMQRAYPIGPGERVLQKTPLGFDVCVWELFWPLVVGAAVVVAPPGAHRDPEALAEQMRRHDVGVLHFVPSMLRAFLEAAGIEDRCGRPRLVFASGEALTADLVAAWRGRFAVPLHNLYGPTEAAVDVTAWTCGAAEEAGEVPIGRPVDNVVARVLDGGMRRVPVGVQGGLWLGGVQLARGYAGAPGLTAEAFRPDPFGAPGERLYRTGDVAAWRADGALVYRGRADAQVKLHGVRIETGEVEAALLAHPGVREAAVRLVEDRLVGWVAPGVPEDIEAFLAARLPAPMRPGVLVAVARMPLTASGKLDRRALVLPEADQRATAMPRGALELRVAALAGQVLGRVPGPMDDLLSLGLHSLAAVRLVNLLRREFGAAPGLGALHAAPNVAALAAAVAGTAQAPSPLVRLRGGAGRPLVLVHPVGGDVACFLRLAARCERPVLAMQSRGLVAGDPAASIDAMAEDYVAALRDAVVGPVTLAGYSMGCAVAFEMARRLQGEVHRLVLLDGAAGGAVDAMPEAAMSLDQARAQGLLPDGFTPDQAARLRAVAQANQRALASWRATPAALCATLLRTDPAAGDLGWGAVLGGGLAIHDIAAPHAALLDEPHCAVVAAILEEAAA